MSESYPARIEALLASLDIPAELVLKRRLVLQEEAENLLLVETDDEGRPQSLAPAAAAAWGDMKTAAGRQGVDLRIASAFRSVDRQVEIVRAKLLSGQSLEEILAVVAPPGYSEHHTGRAVDIATPGSAPVEPAFEATPAFSWLTANAGRFGFQLSFPRGNRFGFQYEPWHWRFHARNQVDNPSHEADNLAS